MVKTFLASWRGGSCHRIGYSLAKIGLPFLNDYMVPISAEEISEQMKRPLEKEFDALSRAKSPQRRGFRFQELVRKIFETSRFDVHSNPRSAKPRQSDLFVNSDETNYLIEAKWQKQKITSADIDDLRARLDRTPGTVIGCFFSMSQYTKDAVAEVELRRQREILLFSREEIHHLAQGREKVQELIKRKRQSLVIQGKVWFSSATSVPRKGHSLLLPTCSLTLVKDGMVQECIAIRNSDNLDVMFASEIPDIRWGMFGSYGVGIETRIPAHSISELRSFLGVVHRELELTSEGAFSIRQLHCSWHGFGVDSFLRQADAMATRYKEAKLTYIHHSEDLHYFDNCRLGSMAFTCRQGTGKERELYSCRLQLRLRGIPADVKPYLRVFEEAGDELPYFVPLNEWNLDHVRLKNRIRLEAPVAKIVSRRRNDDPSVCGIVVRNPFRDKKLIPAGSIEHSPFNQLQSPEYLFCALRDWHTPESIVDYYYLDGVEGMHVDQNVVFRCSGTWNAILNHPHGNFAEGEIPPPLPSRSRRRT